MNLTVRKILPQDDIQVAEVIRKVMTEHGACGSGFAISDPEVDAMSRIYTQANRSTYFVVTDGTRILGGGGIGPLQGADPKTCELRKMYFLPELRGMGFGKKLLDLCLKEAEALGFETCYLETLKSMNVARGLYEKSGFTKRCSPLGATGHHGCDTWYEKKLTSPSPAI